MFAIIGNEYSGQLVVMYGAPDNINHLHQVILFSGDRLNLF